MRIKQATRQPDGFIPSVVVDGELVPRGSQNDQRADLAIPAQRRHGVVDIRGAHTPPPVAKHTTDRPSDWQQAWPALVVIAIFAVPWFIATLLWPSVMIVLNGLFVMWHVKRSYDRLECRSKQIIAIIGLIIFAPILVPLLIVMMLSGKSPCQCCGCC